MWGNRKTYKGDATWREHHRSTVAPPVVNTQPKQESSLAPERVTRVGSMLCLLPKPPSSPLLVSMVVVKEQGIWS